MPSSHLLRRLENLWTQIISSGSSNLNTIDEKLYLLLKKNKDLWVHQKKKRIYVRTARSQATLSRIAGLKAVGKKARDLDKSENLDLRRKKKRAKAR